MEQEAILEEETAPEEGMAPKEEAAPGEEQAPEKKSFFATLKGEVTSFFRSVSEANETFYLVLLSLYLLLFFVMKISWKIWTEHAVEMTKYALLGLVMWGSAFYLFMIICNWKKLWDKTVLFILTGVAIFGLTAYFSKVQTTNTFSAVFDILFCLMAFGRDYRKMLKCLLVVTIVMLIFAALCVPLGLANDFAKPNYFLTSHSLGIEYPNSWGYLAIIGLTSAWYLYLRNKPLITCALFWGVTLFMYNFIGCRTVAVLTAVLPILAFLADFLEKRADKKAELRLASEQAAADEAAVALEQEAVEEDGGKKRHRHKRSLNFWGYLTVAMPLIILVIVVILSVNVEWMHAHFYGTRLKNFAMRFVETGLYFRTFGVKLLGYSYFGHLYPIYYPVNGEAIEVDILDSSYGSYFIMRGSLWVLGITLWLCMGNYKALKKRDYAIPMLCVVFLLIATMERPGLEAWYNFVLLYPLARVASKPGTEPFLELPEWSQPPEPAADALVEGAEVLLADEPAGEPASVLETADGTAAVPEPHQAAEAAYATAEAQVAAQAADSE